MRSFPPVISSSSPYNSTSQFQSRPDSSNAALNATRWPSRSVSASVPSTTKNTAFSGPFFAPFCAPVCNPFLLTIQCTRLHFFIGIDAARPKQAVRNSYPLRFIRRFFNQETVKPCAVELAKFPVQNPGITFRCLRHGNISDIFACRVFYLFVDLSGPRQDCKAKPLIPEIAHPAVEMFPGPKLQRGCRGVVRSQSSGHTRHAFRSW